MSTRAACPARPAVTLKTVAAAVAVRFSVNPLPGAAASREMSKELIQPACAALTRTIVATLVKRRRQHKVEELFRAGSFPR